MKMVKLGFLKKGSVLRPFNLFNISIIDEVMDSFPKNIDGLKNPKEYYDTNGFFDDEDDFNEGYEMILKEIKKFLDGGLIIRVLDMEKGWNILGLILKREKGAGVHWSWEEDLREKAFWIGTMKQFVVLYCKIIKTKRNLLNAINLETTVEENFEWFFADHEITLNDGTELSLIRLKRFKQNRKGRYYSGSDYKEENFDLISEEDFSEKGITIFV